MLYTVSAVQILATLDAFEDFEARIENGRQKVGKCAFSLKLDLGWHTYDPQSLPISKILRRVLLQGTNGANRIRASSMAH